MLGGSRGRQMQTQRDHGGCREPMPLVEALSRWPEVRAPHRLRRGGDTGRITPLLGTRAAIKQRCPPPIQAGGGRAGAPKPLGTQLVRLLCSNDQAVGHVSQELCPRPNGEQVGHKPINRGPMHLWGSPLGHDYPFPNSTPTECIRTRSGETNSPVRAATSAGASSCNRATVASRPKPFSANIQYRPKWRASLATSSP